MEGVHGSGAKTMKTIVYYVGQCLTGVLKSVLMLFSIPMIPLYLCAVFMVEWGHSLQDPKERSDFGSLEGEDVETTD